MSEFNLLDYEEIGQEFIDNGVIPFLIDNESNSILELIRLGYNDIVDTEEVDLELLSIYRKWITLLDNRETNGNEFIKGYRVGGEYYQMSFSDTKVFVLTKQNNIDGVLDITYNYRFIRDKILCTPELKFIPIHKIDEIIKFSNYFNWM